MFWSKGVETPNQYWQLSLFLTKGWSYRINKVSTFFNNLTYYSFEWLKNTSELREFIKYKSQKVAREELVNSEKLFPAFRKKGENGRRREISRNQDSYLSILIFVIATFETSHLATGLLRAGVSILYDVFQNNIKVVQMWPDLSMQRHFVCKLNTHK